MTYSLLTIEQMFYIMSLREDAMSTKSRKQLLEYTISAIQKRWGHQAIHTAVEEAPLVLSTGFPALDRALGTGGLPRGRLSELIGCGTAGQGTLAIQAIAQAQRVGQQVAYVDVEHTIDLDALARAGVRLETLVVLRPLSLSHALEMTGDLVAAGAVGTIILDHLHDLALLTQSEAAQGLDRALREWTPQLGRSLCTMIILTETASPGLYPSGLALPYFASVRLECERQNWLRHRGRITGFIARVRVLKNKLGPSGQEVLLKIRIGG